jgi:hypothetical protein
MKTMKTKLIILTFCFAVVAFAADMTITIPTADVPRVQEAYGHILNLGRPANLSEVQRATTQWIHNTTLDYERRKDIAQFSPPPLEMQPSPIPSPTPGELRSTTGQQAASPTATPKKR